MVSQRTLVFSLALASCWALTLGFFSPCLGQDPVPQRGDANSDRRVDIADPIFLLTHIFSGGKAPSCRPAANANGDLRLDISDAITLLTYLFATPTPLPPLTEAELALCEVIVPPPPPTVLRHGTYQDVIDPPHGIVGSHVEMLSDRTVRISNFYYDGLGFPRVVVFLTREAFANEGVVLGGDLLRDHPYVNETMTLPIPAGVDEAEYKFVNIWCDYFPLTYAVARLYDGPLP